jgi:hypothetical protein
MTAAMAVFLLVVWRRRKSDLRRIQLNLSADNDLRSRHFGASQGALWCLSSSPLVPFVEPLGPLVEPIGEEEFFLAGKELV